MSASTKRIAAIAFVALVAGCGDSAQQLDRVVVHGRITYDGQPVTAGDIFFVPIGKTSGPTTGAKIKDGKYRADQHGGVPAGTHRVKISGYLVEPPPPLAPDGPVDQREYPMVSAKYGAPSTLEITLSADAGEINRDFTLTK